MNKRLFKYMICLMFVFTQVQMFANLNKNDNPWSNIVTSPVIDIYDYLPQSFKSNTAILNNDLRLDVTVSNECVNESGTSHTYTFTVTNVGDNTVVLSNSNQATINFSRPDGATGDFTFEGLGTSGTYGDWSWSRTLVSYNYTFKYPASGIKELSPGEEVKFSISRSYSIASEGNSRILNANLTYTRDEDLSNNNSVAKVFRKKSDLILYREISTTSTFILQNVAGVTGSASDYDFYEAGTNTIIEDSKAFSQSIPKKYEFEYSPKGVNCRSKVIIFIGTDPGAISVANNKVCYGSTVTIDNAQSGDGSSGYLLKYTWEVSYDDGKTWQAPTDKSGADSDGSKTVTISDVTSDFLIRRKAHERPTNTRENNYAYSNVLSISVVQNNIIFPNNTNTFAISEGSVFNFPNITTSLPSNIEIYDVDGKVVYKKEGGNITINTTITGLPKGTHSYTVKATTITGADVVGCESYSSISLTVYDLADCNKLKVKTFATHSKEWTSGLSGVANPENAVHGDRSQYATLTGGVVLLGIGTVGIDLYFTKPNPANPNERIMVSPEEMIGKKVTVKLGEQYSGLKLAGGMSARAINTSKPINDLSAAPSLTGATYGVKGGVLDLLKGDNVFEFSFVPAKTSGQLIPFNGIRIQLGSLLGVADLGTVFHAYIEDEITIDPENNTCSILPIEVTPASSLVYPTEQKGKTVSNSPITLNKFIDDVTWGNYTEVLNVASGLSSVTFPYYAVDDNYNSYAIFNTTAGVLNKQFLKANLRQLARPGDQVQITLGTEQVNVLNLGLLSLSAYKIKYYLGDTQVGEQQLDRFKVLDLGLLNFSNEQKIVISTPISVPFDRIQLEQWNTINVNLGNQLYIYDMRINPQMLFEGEDDSKNITTLCAADFLAIQKMDPCTSFEVSFAHVLEYGDQLIDEDGKLMVDDNGRPILSINEVEDIIDSELMFNSTSGTVDYFEIKRLYPEYGNDLLVKIQTKRQGCNYGDPQYLRVKLINCSSAIVNPVIKSGVK